VLNSGGFHLKECSQVTFLIGVDSPSTDPPTPKVAGVNIKPSILYSRVSF